MYLQLIKNISIQNKYCKWYFNIISNALSREINSNLYYEKHHILPKSFKLGGEKDKNNVVSLTAREHFICHWLLSKMFTGKFKKKMYFAFHRMFSAPTQYKENRYVNSKAFESLRINISEIQSNRIVSLETRQKMSNYHKKLWEGETGQIKKLELSKKFKGRVAPNKGVPCSKEKKKNISKATTGIPKIRINPRNYTLNPVSLETKEKQSILNKNRPKSCCIFCRKICDIANFNKWHGDRCKLKPYD